LLGKVAIAADERDIELANRKCRALLGYLALSDAGEETRERLMGTLWSETEEERARASLRQTLYEIRTALEPVAPGFITANKIAIVLDREACEVDVWSVLAEASEGRTHPRLIETERLPEVLLAEFETIDPAFRTWLIAKRQSLHDRLVRNLEQVLRDESAGPRKADAAHGLINLEPTHEEAARYLMIYRRNAGDIGGALAIYKRLWDLLADEFDVEPSKETQELVVALKLAQSEPAEPPKPASTATAGDPVHLATVEGPAMLAVIARGVSTDQVRTLETLMATGPGANWRPLTREGEKAWLVEATSAAEAAKIAFHLQSACRRMEGAGPQLFMGAHALPADASIGLHHALAGAAEPGQLMATQEFRDQLTDGLDATVHDLGFIQPSQSSESVRVFTVSPPEKPGVLMPEGARLRPAIAVLPFELRAANDDAVTLGELLADEIITALSGTKTLDVISRLSTRAMAQQRFGLSQIWSHLRSDYVLAGQPRTRHNGNELVIELTDVKTKTIQWSDVRKIGALDAAGARELAESIASEVMAAILVSESERATTSPLGSLQSYTLLFAAITLMDRWTRASFERSRELLFLLRDRATRHPLPNAWLSAWHIRSISQGWTRDAAADGRAAIDFAQRSLDADPHNSLALAMDGWASVHAHKRLDIASERLLLAVEANPSDSLAWLLKGVTHAFAGDGEAAASSARHALRLSPLDPRKSYYDSMSATAALAAGQYEDGAELARSSLRANRLHPSTLRALAACQWWSGQQAEARQTVTQLLRLNPTMTISRYLHAHPARDSKVVGLTVDALRNAGVPA
jgi:DNA-binding SARP family transcriptional activator/TolB-like protein